MPDRPEKVTPNSDDLTAFVSGLAVRVNDHGDVIRGVRAEVHELRSTMATAASVTALSAKIDGLIASKAPQWSTYIAAVSLLITLVVGYTTLTAWPINASLSELKAEAKEDRRAVISEFKEVRGLVVPRGEHEQRWANQAATTASIQKQIEDQGRTYGSTYSLRDALNDIQKRMDKMEMGLTAVTPATNPRP